MSFDMLRNSEMKDVIDSETGELMEDCVVLSKKNYEKNIKDKMDEIAKNKDKRNRKYYKQNADNVLGNFIGIRFEKYQNLAQDLPAQELFRLVYFSTFLGYDGYLHLTQRKKMTLERLRICSKLKNTTYRNTINTLLEKGYLILETNGIKINANFATKGKLILPPSSNVNFIFRKVSISKIRKIYNEIQVKDHNIVGYILRMLPYLNNDNILSFCSENTDEVIPILEKDFCGLQGLSIDKSNVSKMMKKIYNIRSTGSIGLLLKVKIKDFDKKVLAINPTVVGMLFGKRIIEINNNSAKDTKVVKFGVIKKNKVRKIKGYKTYDMGKILMADKSINTA